MAVMWRGNSHTALWNNTQGGNHKKIKVEKLCWKCWFFLQWALLWGFCFYISHHTCDFRVNGDSYCQDQKINDWSEIFRENISNFSSKSLTFEGLLIFCSLSLYIQLQSLSSLSAAEENPSLMYFLAFYLYIKILNDFVFSKCWYFQKVRKYAPLCHPGRQLLCWPASQTERAALKAEEIHYNLDTCAVSNDLSSWGWR